MTAEWHTHRAAANTSTGNQDFTTTKCGGVTPDAALVIVSYAVTDESADADAGFSIGLTDGTRELCFFHSSEDDQGSTDTYKVSQSDMIVDMRLPGSTNAIGQGTATLITNGVRINWTDAPGSAFQVTCIFFTGWDDAYVNYKSAPTQDTAYDVTDPNFSVSAAIFIMNYTTMDSGSNWAKLSLGFATPDANFCIGIDHGNNKASGDPQVEQRNDYVCYDPAGSGGNLAIEISSWDSQGFTLTPRLGSGTDVGYLALRTASQSVKVGSTTLPASGDLDVNNRRSVTGLGFQPNSIMLGHVYAAAENTNYDQGYFGLLFSDGTDDYTCQITDEANADPTNAKSWSDNEWSVLDEDAVGQNYTGLLYSFDSDGWTDEWSTAATSAVKAFYFAVGDVGSTTYTKTFTASAYLKKTGLTKQFTAAGYLQKAGLTKEFTAAGYLANRNILTTTLSAYLKGTFQKTFTASAYLKKLGVTKTFTAAGYLSLGDPFAVGQNTDELSTVFGVNSGSQRGYVIFVFARGANPNNANCTGVTLDGVSGNLGISEYETVLEDSQYHRASVFYWLDGNMPANTGSYDAVATFAAGTDNDVIMIGKQLANIEQQAPEGASSRSRDDITNTWTNITTITDDAEVIDGVLHREPGATFTASDPAGREVQNDVTIGNLSAAIGLYTEASAGNQHPDWSSDKAANTMVSVGLAFAPGSVSTYVKTFLAAAYLQIARTKNFTAAGYVQSTKLKNFIAAGYLALPVTKTFTAAGYLSKKRTLSFTAAAYINEATTRWFQAAAYLQKTNTVSFTAAAYLQSLTKQVSFEAAAYLVQPSEKLLVFKAAGHLVKRNTLTFTAAGYLFRGVTFKAAGYLQKTRTLSFTAAGYIRQRPGQWDKVSPVSSTWSKR